ncbi:MAG: hypothetical protein VZS44_11230, partial [Bacilli bacterium]|nr:hypothetical protein [Bacilli bacterium]
MNKIVNGVANDYEFDFDKSVDTFRFNMNKERKELYKQIEQLQSNWNSLREWLEEYLENEKYSYMSDNPKDRCRYDVFNEVLDKMN